MPDFSNVCTGLIHTPPADGVRRFTALFRRDTPPRSCDWHRACALDPQDPLGNFKYGDCLPAGFHRQAQIRLANAAGSTEFRPNVNLVLESYHDWAGFDPKTGANDRGTRLDVAQTIAAQHGIDIGRNQSPEVPLPVTLDHGDRVELMLAVHRLGTVGFCLNLPRAWQDAEVWDVPEKSDSDARPGGWGAHYVACGRYEANGHLFVVITWGLEMVITWRALEAYCLSASSQLASSWLRADGKTPTGLTRDELRLEAARLAA